MKRFWLWLRSLWTTKEEAAIAAELETPDDAARWAEHRAELDAWDKALYDATGTGPYAEKIQREREAMEIQRKHQEAMCVALRNAAAAGMLGMGQSTTLTYNMGPIWPSEQLVARRRYDAADGWM